MKSRTHIHKILEGFRQLSGYVSITDIITHHLRLRWLVGKSEVIAVRSAVTKVQGEVNFDPGWSPDESRLPEKRCGQK